MKKEEIRKNSLPTSDSHLGGGYLESKRNPGGNRKKILLIIVGILLTLGIVIGVSYAWWTHTVSQEGINIIQTTCLEIELADENPITLQNAYPITDVESRVLIPYTFTIKNKCDSFIEYDVNLDIMESKDASGKDNRLDSSYIAIEINGGEKQLLNTLESVEVSYQGNYNPVESRYLLSGGIGAKESQSNSIKLWMDEHVTLDDDAVNKTFISKIVVTAKHGHIVRLVDYIINSNDMEEMYKIEHEETVQTPALTDYRYIGKNPNNYVCFGSEEVPCPSENLYRIIGAMPTQSTENGEYENRVKLIKSTNYGGKTYTPGSFPDLDFRNTTLFKDVLNKEYWDSLGEWQKYIEDAKWYFGAIRVSNSASSTDSTLAVDFYRNERRDLRVSSNSPISFIAKVGLMSASDYGFATSGTLADGSPDNCYQKFYITGSGFSACDLNDWLSTKTNNQAEHMYPMNNYYNNLYMTDTRGYCVHQTGGTAAYIRPSIYLKANVALKSGDGTQENPFTISIDE